MEISVAKTKMMVVLLARSQQYNHFTWNGLAVGCIETFKHLDLPFHASGDTSHHITPVKAKAAGSLAVMQQRHSQPQCGNTLNFNLFIVLVASLHYGRGLWGMHSPCAAKTARTISHPSKTDTIGTSVGSDSLHLVRCC